MPYLSRCGGRQLFDRRCALSQPAPDSGRGGRRAAGKCGLGFRAPGAQCV